MVKKTNHGNEKTPHKYIKNSNGNVDAAVQCIILTDVQYLRKSAPKVSTAARGYEKKADQYQNIQAEIGIDHSMRCSGISVSQRCQQESLTQ